jgi:hypothetical protein
LFILVAIYIILNVKIPALGQGGHLFPNRRKKKKGKIAPFRFALLRNFLKS